MADKKWVSATGDVNATASYDTASLPVANDRLFWPATNSQSALTNLAALTAIDLDLFYVDKGFGGTIGFDGTPIEFSADVLKMYGAKPLHYKDGGGTTDLALIACSRSSVVVTLDGTSITKIIVLRGNVTIQSSAGAITDLEVGWIDNRGSDATVTIEAGAGTITNLRMSGGTVSSNGAVTNAIVDGGNLTQDNATITTLDIYSGGVNYNFAGTITTANLRGGLFDLTTNDLAKTITTLNRFPGSDLKRDTDIHTITTLNDFRENQ